MRPGFGDLELMAAPADYHIEATTKGVASLPLKSRLQLALSSHNSNVITTVLHVVQMHGTAGI
jgi:hypothetical protein